MDGVAAVPLASTEGSTDGGAPRLDLDGFSGPLDLLLALAREGRINLLRIPLHALVDQLAQALRPTLPLAEQGGWLAMAAWLVLLRSRLLLPREAPDQAAAGTATHLAARRGAGRLRQQLLGLQRVQDLAAWLQARPQLGRDVFGHGQRQGAGLPPGAGHNVGHQVDVVEFLWACMELFEDGSTGTAPAHQSPRLPLHLVREAQARILRQLAGAR